MFCISQDWAGVLVHDERFGGFSNDFTSTAICITILEDESRASTQINYCIITDVF